MAKSDIDSIFVDERRQLDPVKAQMDCRLHNDDYDGVIYCQDDYNGMIEELGCCTKYTQDELKFISKSLDESRLKYLEIEGVKNLNWDAILAHRNCVLDELRVTIKSPHVLADLAKALFKNRSLSILELDYYHIDDDLHDGEIEKENDSISDTPSANAADSYSSLNEIFFEALMPLHHVVLKGITPIRPSSSILFDDLGLAPSCSWRHVTIEDCYLTEENITWLPPCITNLEEIVITNCELSPATIKMLSEIYLTISASRCWHSSRNSNRTRFKKSPLRILDLSNNDWLLTVDDRSSEAANDNRHLFSDDEEDSLNQEKEDWKSRNIPSPSCSSILASWLDSLSNLVELDLSNNPQLFFNDVDHDSRGMSDLCGTVNQSLKRLSLRNCQLIPDDLHQMIGTFCWLEVLDLSENPALISSLSLISQLEYLAELELENMIEYRNNETFEFDRRVSDEGFDWETESDGLMGLLLELLNVESEYDPHNYGSIRGSQRHRQKPLKRLNLSGNIIQKEALHILSLFNSLEVLSLMGCQINGDGIIELMSGAHQSPSRRSSLIELYLGSNMIGDIGILTLAQNIKDQRLPFLKVLDLESNVISVDAFRVFVEDGLEYSNYIHYLHISDDGAITENQQQTWNDLHKVMEHNLSLNRAGRFALFVDGHCSTNDEKDEEILIINYQNEGNNGFCNKKIQTNLWPLILKNADSVYGTDALFYFLHKRPDLFLCTRNSDMPNSNYITPIKSTSEARSPNGVDDIARFLL